MLQHCHDGGANCLVSCTTQHHIGDRGHPWNTFLMIVWPCGANSWSSIPWDSKKAVSISLTMLCTWQAFFDLDAHNIITGSHHLLKVFHLVVTQFLAKFDAVALLQSFYLQWKSDKSIKHSSLKCCLPLTDAIDRWEKIHACIWRFKVASCKCPLLKSIRVGLSDKKKVGYFSNRPCIFISHLSIKKILTQRKLFNKISATFKGHVPNRSSYYGHDT